MREAERRRPLIDDGEGSSEATDDNRLSAPTASKSLDVITREIFVLDETEQQAFGDGEQQQRVGGEHPREGMPNEEIAPRKDRLVPGQFSGVRSANRDRLVRLGRSDDIGSVLE